jgi:hypothetical protein
MGSRRLANSCEKGKALPFYGRRSGSGPSIIDHPESQAQAQRAPAVTVSQPAGRGGVAITPSEVPAANAVPNFHFCHFFAVLCFPLVVVKFIHCMESLLVRLVS